MQKQSIDLQEVFQYLLLEARATWRYRWHALAVAWGVMIVGALLVFSLPNKYEASSQVYADTEALTNPLLKGIAVQPNVGERLQIITHTLLSRPNVESVADQTGLSLRATTPAAKDALLADLAKSVKIDDAGARNLYNIRYADRDRNMAQKVVQAFLQILMNDTLGANTAATATAQNFLQQQVNDYAKRLTDEEKKIADFEKANIGLLSSRGSDGDFVTRLQEAQVELQALQDQYTAVASGHASAGTRAANPKAQEISAQISAYQKQLDTLLLSYTEAYPDVISTRRKIADLKAQRKTLPAYFAGGPVTKDALSRQITAKKAEIASLQQSVDKGADVQVELRRLTRNYETDKKQYNELVSRLNTAQLSQDATQSGNNLKFRVINPPAVPVEPSSPMRGLLLLMVFALAIGIGVAFAYFMHRIRPVFVSLKRLREAGGHPVLGAMSMVVSRARLDERRREVVQFCTGAGLLAVVLVVGLLFAGSFARLVQHFFVMGGA